MKCRFCGNETDILVVDLGLQPLSNSYIKKENVCKGQHFLPLKVFYCDECKLTQIENYDAPQEIFNDEYKYYSSFSSSWLKHSSDYVGMIVERLSLDETSKVMEIASNDGYLLQYFLEYGIHPVGIEPSSSTAQIAKEKGIETYCEFWGKAYSDEYVKQNGKLDLIIGNNVLAHVPDIKDFVAGIKNALNEMGTVTMEFPHLLNLLKYNQFDTIYHEHFSYISLLFAKRLFEESNLEIYDVEKLSTHGGSLRIYAKHMGNKNIKVCGSVAEILKEELEYGLDDKTCYEAFNHRVENLKIDIIEKLYSIKKHGKKIVAYGAAAKGNTLLNYCGIKNDVIDYVCDASPYKQGLLLPGSLIPIVSPEEIRNTKPDYILIVPWNLEKEIKDLLSYTKEWDAKLLTFIPDVHEVC